MLGLGEQLEYLDQMTKVSTEDIPSFLGLCGVYLAYRIAMVRGPLKSLARILKAKREMKFIHRTFDMIHYVVATIVGLLALARRPYGHCFAWAKDCQPLMVQNPDGFELSLFEKVYFLLFFAYYIVDIFFVYTSSEPILLLFHHIITISEVGACVLLQSPVVALSIMLLHDLTDTPLYIGKFFIYIDVQIVPTVLLGFFALAVTHFRIINYPIIVWHVWAVGLGTNIWPKLYYFESSCLVGLYLMHIFWEYKIIQAIFLALGKKEVQDQRSD
jgi:hypothetical protein